MKYQIAQFTSTGGRPHNEDRAGIAERKNAVLLAVADGLGGHSGGELAAQTAVETVLRLFRGVKHLQFPDPFAFLALTMLKAHSSVVARARAHTPPLEARTTCVLCLVQSGYAYWAHVGDSRLYHFRGTQLVKRTEDHSTIEELRRDGVITEDEMANHPRKSYLLRSLGGSGEPRISLGEETPLQPGDSILLCSDGLWEGMPTNEIGRYLATPKLENGIEEMLYTTEKRMGESCDNVTIACLRWEDRAAAPSRLRAPMARQVDADLLWRGAATKVAAQRAAPAPKDEPAQPTRRGSIESSIQEIEDYLRRHEPKN
jgi:serine/threonine protein phosphatase PrpC